MLKVKIFMSASGLVQDIPDFEIDAKDIDKNGDSLSVQELDDSITGFNLREIFAWRLIQEEE